MTTQYVPTATNMVTIVRNIIEGYRMGPIRALAQEPVQNSKDAARGRAHVEYRIHRRPGANGSENYMLTVTDRNTSGLGGPVLSFQEIQRRGNILNSGDNWAAFEGMGYTKEDESALGSRGQGKAAFLYHSRLPRVGSDGQDRMMILYDTLLEDGTYRLGVRYASPFDTVLAQPFVGDIARSTVSSRYMSDDGIEIDLELAPLESVGTRIIVPHLSVDVVDAIRSGELYQWLQHCWWRAVQAGLNISIVDEQGNAKSVTVPSWWQDEPWTKGKPGVKAYNDIDVSEDLKIKRIVLLYHESLSEPKIEGVPPQFWGVQLLRGQQWIETLGLELSDFIPRDKRMGFRGFVEFDRRTERELRRAETSQHESFDRHVSGVKALISAIEDKVREFSREQGWITRDITRPVSSAERTAALEFLQFLSPNARSDSENGLSPTDSTQLKMDLRETRSWECALLLDFPDPYTARVDWGQHIRDVEVSVVVEPSIPLERVAVSLELAFIRDKTTVPVTQSLELELQNGRGVVKFGDFQVITGQATPGKLKCVNSGKYRLTTRVKWHGTEVARSSRNFFVKDDPPHQGTNPYALSISVENHSTRQRRINSGDTIGVQVSVSNRTAEAQPLELTASLGDLLLADMLRVQTTGTPPGASPSRVAGVQSQIIINPAERGPHQHVNLPPGKHEIRADLYFDGEVVAHASSTLHVEVDPAQPDEWPPFRIEQISGDGHHPRWQFQKKSQDDWTLQYPLSYPLYRALNSSPSRNGTQMSGVSAFVVDICAEAIIEWAMEPLDSGNSSRLYELLDGVPVGADTEYWEEYREKMEELAGLRRSSEQVDRYGHLVRECAALSLSMFEERE